MEINVNGRNKDVGENLTHVDYDLIVKLAYSGEDAPRGLHTVSYQDGVNNAEGTLTLTSKPIQICEGMIFNCVITDNS